MWLLFLNSLKGLKAKKVQMIGLVCLIIASTGIYTAMGSAMDRLDSMADEYMEEQNVEHMTVILNETKILTRENIADMFNDKLSAWKDIELEPIEISDEELASFDEETLEGYREMIRAQGVPEPYVDTYLKQTLGEVMAGPNYLLGVLDGTNPVDDVSTYLFYGCAASATNEETNKDPNLPYAKFCPTNPSKEASEYLEGDSKKDNKDECEETDSSSSEAATYIMKLYNNFSAMTDTSKYGVDKYQYLNKVMDELAEQYDFTYVLKGSKTLGWKFNENDEQEYSASMMVYDKDLPVNTPYLIEGRAPSNLYEVLVAPRFLETNDLTIGDNLEINGVEYKITGSAYAPDYIYPAVSFNTPVFDEKRQTIMYANQETYDLAKGSEMKLYTARFNSYEGTYRDDALEDLIKDLNKDEYVTYVLSTATIHPRISTFTYAVKIDRKFAEYFLYVLLAIAVFIIVMVMKKRIDDEKLQIGVLKSLGYSTPMIAAGYLVYPIVGSVVGGALGYLLGMGLQNFMVDLYRSFYNIPINAFYWGYEYLFFSVLLPLVGLSLLSYFVALFMLRHRPLKLLREGSNLKVNVVTKAITRVTRPLPFKARFRYSLASRSLGKLLVITFCSFCTGLLLVLTLIGSNMMNKMIDKTFAGASYSYMVSYEQIQDPSVIENYNENHEGEDLVLQTDLTLYKVIRKDGTIKTLDKTRSLEVNGVDAKNLSLLHITDYDGKDISENLYKENEDGIDNIIINDTIKTLLDIDVGDTLVVSKRVNVSGSVQCANDKQYYVSDINGTFSGLTSYVTIESLSDYLNYDNASYNIIYTNENKEEYNPANEKISSNFGVDDLKKNVSLAIEMANISVYIIIAFAGVMALVIISVVSNIVVEENKKHISLMKVMGYKDKEISKVVLNIYTPFVIIAYFLSIPAMEGILRFILKLALKDMEMSVPIDLSLQGMIIGLVVIVVAYFIALQFSKKALNRVALSEALKRE